MIKPNEIRIGNYFKIDGEIQKTHSIEWYEVDECYYVFYYEGCTSCVFKDIEPIPLTEEILLKCGAVKCGYNYSVNGVNLWYSYYKKKYVIRHLFVGSDIEREISLNNLHSFQNIMFSLTNKELEINL